MFKLPLIAAAFAAGLAGASAQAATLTADFQVTAHNVTNLNRNQSKATLANFNAAAAGTLGGANSVSTSDTFSYNGGLDFRVNGPQRASQDIDDWLATGTGTVSGLDSTFGNKQLSFPNINNGTATTTFFLFTTTLNALASFNIGHDDGVLVLDDGVAIGQSVGPTTFMQTFVDGFDGGLLQFLYVSTNGNPSIFEVDAELTPVPVPASLPLLAGAVGVMGWATRRRRKAS